MNAKKTNISVDTKVNMCLYRRTLITKVLQSLHSNIHPVYCIIIFIIYSTPRISWVRGGRQLYEPLNEPLAQGVGWSSGRGGGGHNHSEPANTMIMSFYIHTLYRGGYIGWASTLLQGALQEVTVLQGVSLVFDCSELQRSLGILGIDSASLCILAGRYEVS